MNDLRNIDSLRLHPDAAKVPLPNGPDLERLRESLRENGQEDPVDITPDDIVLDGRTRLTLLRELGSQTVMVRVLDIPDRDQTNYIVDRALARRHLTNEQKRALNDLLRAVVSEETVVESTGEKVRIGMSRPQRAAKLGVTLNTVEAWDKDHPPKTGYIDAPTHIRREGGIQGACSSHGGIAR